MTDSQTQAQTLSVVQNSKGHQVIKPALIEATMERILETTNVRRAWQQVKRNHGAPGIDGMTTEEFPKYARESWGKIRSEIEVGSYLPAPVLRVEIPKRSGGSRPHCSKNK